MLSSCAAQGIPRSDMDLEEFGLELLEVEAPLQDVGAGPAPAPSRRLLCNESPFALRQWTSRYSNQVKLVWIVGRSPPRVSLDDLQVVIN